MSRCIQLYCLVIYCLNLLRVIDLGVMTPCDKIINSAIQEKAG